MNPITMKAQIDPLLLAALREDISNEDVSTNAVIREETPGEVELLAKQDGVVAGLDVFARVFTLLDERTEVTFLCKDGDAVRSGQLLGRVRGDIRVLLSGERVALNMPIQGTAADIIKIAMIKVNDRLEHELPSAHLILQVHDELIVECFEKDSTAVCKILEEEMSNAANLAVKLSVDAHCGKNWLEAKS